MKDPAKLKALHQEITTAREAGLLNAALAQRIHAEAILAAENNPHFLEFFFHVLPPELLKRAVVRYQNQSLEGEALRKVNIASPKQFQTQK
jgi:hypothetical protein